MSLEDGEYELDISVLLQNASTIDTPTSTSKDTSENIAIRYGFIPDSMDQSKPLKLYQKDQTCILKALSTEGSNKPIFLKVYLNVIIEIVQIVHHQLQILIMVGIMIHFI